MKPGINCILPKKVFFEEGIHRKIGAKLNPV